VSEVRHVVSDEGERVDSNLGPVSVRLELCLDGSPVHVDSLSSEREDGEEDQPVLLVLKVARLQLLADLSGKVLERSRQAIGETGAEQG